MEHTHRTPEQQQAINEELINAAKDRDSDRVAFLLDQGANVNATGLFRLTALRLAAMEGCVEMVKMLIAAGAHVNHIDFFGNTALRVATRGGHIDVVRVLIDHGADVNYADNNGDTALILATEAGYINIAELLIRAGADINRANRKGITPLVEAINRSNGAIVLSLMHHGAKLPSGPKFILKIKLKKMLKKIVDNDFIVAVIVGTTKRVSQLLQQEPLGVIHMPDRSGKTALYWAAARGNNDLVRLLLEHNFNIDAQDAGGNTPLHVAAANGNLSTVKLLVARGAQATLVNQHGNSPLALARQYHHPDVVAFLEEQAAPSAFGRISTLGRGGRFEWRPTLTGELLPPDIARQIAQFALAPGHIPPAGSL